MARHLMELRKEVKGSFFALAADLFEASSTTDTSELAEGPASSSSAREAAVAEQSDDKPEQ